MKKLQFTERQCYFLQSVIDRNPGGLTPEKFKFHTLESSTVHDDGWCCPPGIANMFLYHSLLMKMFMDGLIRRVNFRHDEPIEPYVITEKGKAELAKMMESRP